MIRPHLVPAASHDTAGDPLVAVAGRRSRPTLVVVRGGRAGAPAPFVVSPPGLVSVSSPSSSLSSGVPGSGAARAARAAEVDPCRCRQLRPRWR